MALRIRLTHDHQEATASAIYGLIVSGAVIATSQASTALAVDGAVLVTLMVYWAAERYARIVAERVHEGHRPAWSTVRRAGAGGRLHRGERVAAAVVAALFGVAMIALKAWLH